MPPRERTDVVVIGAGCAGLAAARVLSEAGRRVVVLEARSRLGGRAFTLHDSEWPVPIELGAEFLHGEAEETRAIARAAGLAVVELPDVHVWAQRGRLRPMGDVWQRLAKLRERIPGSGPDLSFAAFLKRHRVSPDLCRMARLFVEGYFAARLERASAQALKAQDGEADEPSRQYRIVEGYSGVVRSLRAALDAERVLIRRNAPVSEVRWRRGRVEVRYLSAIARDERTVTARAAVVTLPLGVLKAEPGQPGAVLFAPVPPALRAAVSRLEVSHACKLALRFREAFWDDRSFFRKRLDRSRGVEPERIDFLHDPDGAFPTWWASSPWRVPVLTAWAGGPQADALRDLNETDVIRTGLTALASMLRVRRAWLEDRLDGWRLHDWRRDPWSRGAYSYVGVGGLAAQKALARPVEKTLFFAGEALDATQMGTVAGAIASGQRAARLVLMGNRSTPK